MSVSANKPHFRFQFRLRTLLVVVTIVAVQCAVCLPMLREWQESQTPQAQSRRAVQQAIEWLRKHQDPQHQWALSGGWHSVPFDDPDSVSISRSGAAAAVGFMGLGGK